jgi:hypothetical protein
MVQFIKRDNEKIGRNEKWWRKRVGGRKWAGK